MRLSLTAWLFGILMVLAGPCIAQDFYGDSFVASKKSNAKYMAPQNPPQIFLGKDRIKDKQRMEELGFELIGYSDFQAADVPPDAVMTQAKNVQADTVLLYSERASNTPASVKMQKLREAKSGDKTSLDSGVIYRYFASYWAKIAKPSLGVHVKVPNPEEANQGLEILVVLENSRAKAMGLMKGDILLSLGDQPLDNVEHLSQALKQYAGQTVALVYTRNNMRFDEKISLD